jgi:uncharacterized membrane protein required for colicin V production
MLQVTVIFTGIRHDFMVFATIMMNYIDILLLVIVLLVVISNIKRGFIICTLDLISWVSSVLLGFMFYQPVSAFAAEHVPSLGVWTIPLSFILVVFFFRLILDALFHFFIRNIPREVHANPVNKVLGVFPGVINGTIWAALVAICLLLLPIDGKVTDEARESKLADRVVANVGWFEERLFPIFGEAFSKGIPGMTGTVDHEKSVTLPYKLNTDKARPDLETQMLALVNKERTQRGLRPLKADTELTETARKHSIDMFARGYFSHITPEGKTPFDRMRRDKVTFVSAGENLALAPTLSMAHTGLMNSPGHRANILSPNYGRLGIGIIDGGIRGIMVTQNFRN